jgi:hypothetical protein
MSNTLTVKITSKKLGVTGTLVQFWEGTATLSSRVRPTKVQKQDGDTCFSTRAALVQTATKLAGELGLTLKIDEKATLPVKKAAKKSAKKPAKKSTDCCSGNSSCTPPWMMQ